ncbi:PT dipeptide repeat lipoprotein [Acinetobacter sp. ABJ_C4_1]|uniref:PT dipeptide repeat lipoprotein n=1 Tax=Acinetobacter sp. ABJ_C4_1 TaxID=3377080 RepID=UPI0037C6861D
MDVAKDINCRVRATAPAYSLTKPRDYVDEAQYRVVPATTYDNLIVKANQFGAEGYILYKDFILNRMVAGENKSHIFIKFKQSEDKYLYDLVDISNNIDTGNYVLIADERERKAKQGYLLKSIYNIDKNHTKLLFVKNLKNSNIYSYDQIYNLDESNVDEKNILNQLNTLGSQSCRYQYTHVSLLNNQVESGLFDIPVCLKTVGDNTKYSYRWVDNLNKEENFDTSPTLFEKLLKDQAKDGYQLVDDNNTLHLKNKTGYLFEKDSSNNNMSSLYKVYSAPILRTTDSPNILYNRLQDQGNLGWFLLTNRVYINKLNYSDLIKPNN